MADDALICHSLLDEGNERLADTVNIHQLVDLLLILLSLGKVAVSQRFDPAGSQLGIQVGDACDTAAAAAENIVREIVIKTGVYTEIGTDIPDLLDDLSSMIDAAEGILDTDDIAVLFCQLPWIFCASSS